MRETIVSRGLLSPPPPPDIFFDWKRSVLAAVRQPEKNREGEDELCGKLRVGREGRGVVRRGENIHHSSWKTSYVSLFAPFFGGGCFGREETITLCACVSGLWDRHQLDRRGQKKRERKGNLGKNSFSSPAQDASLKIP